MKLSGTRRRTTGELRGRAARLDVVLREQGGSLRRGRPAPLSARGHGWTVRLPGLDPIRCDTLDDVQRVVDEHPRTP